MDAGLEPTTTGNISYVAGSVTYTSSSATIEMTLQFVIALLIYAGNALILAATPKLRRMKPTTRYLILHLAVSDLLVGVAFTIRNSAELAGASSSDTRLACLVVIAFILVSCENSVTGIMFLAMDIHWSIRAPQQHKSRDSSQRALWLIGACWIWWVLFDLLIFVLPAPNDMKAEKRCYFGSSYYPKWYTIILTSYGIGIFGVTSYILCLSVCRLNKVTPFQPSTQSWQSANPANNSTITANQLKRSKAMMKLTTAVLTAFGISWLPILVIILLGNVIPSFYDQSNALQAYLILPALFHSFINVVLYCYKNKEFRDRVRAIVCVSWSRHQGAVMNTGQSKVRSVTDS